MMLSSMSHIPSLGLFLLFFFFSSERLDFRSTNLKVYLCQVSIFLSNGKVLQHLDCSCEPGMSVSFLSSSSSKSHMAEYERETFCDYLLQMVMIWIYTLQNHNCLHINETKIQKRILEVWHFLASDFIVLFVYFM